jgi:hypothetical protein
MKITKSWIQSKLVNAKAKQDSRFLMHFIGRALLVLLKNQTTEEQSSSTVVEKNGIGFVAWEAEIGTSHAKFYQQKKFLTEKQYNFWLAEKEGFARICKYYRQLNEAAKEKENDR